MDTPQSDLLRPIELIAIDPAQNIRRRYVIRVTADLFGAFIVETHWGRIGTKGQGKCLSFADRDAAARYVSAILRRRSTARSRIGVAYAPVRSGVF